MSDESNTDDNLQLYCDFKITAYDRDGEVVQKSTVTETGSVTMEDISTNALVKGVDEIKVEVLSVETRRGGNTEISIERADESEVPSEVTP
ncbi:hypothetical protein PN419_00605 [Halorubrum ezzemoulense]|uniref:hypothetical protein n=1 Tax=Halorubrum ezzemoulense TaxID=337243 RepID=UPI00232A8FFB|nr:hypothetical protein [Halorubrum ezzemoulense]MDB9247508.1 hypothetical protein [Halorubrum ezzemoulense]MDB9258583.1 hypothetical protein [Halorubrum ezzemoulense]MDB9264558.1 hypothetical protein [Halorubrum ezzemoulense]MDB9268944.1 hypothetical protein [Halorubrum ezzemoulense]MDB9271526.1 hypothetical protein [Halorubrum ezzemoulense]